eukprot:3381159-Amphidinium_carterae.1
MHVVYLSFNLNGSGNHHPTLSAEAYYFLEFRGQYLTLPDTGICAAEAASQSASRKIQDLSSIHWPDAGCAAAG